MKIVFNFIISLSLVIFLCLFLNNAWSLGNQKGSLVKMKNGEAVTLGLNKTIIIQNIWKDKSLNKNWNVKVKLLAIEKEGANLQINSSTFLGTDFIETKSIKIGDYIYIIQAEEVTTKIELTKVSVNDIIFSLTVQSAPPAPEVSESFDIEIKQ